MNNTTLETKAKLKASEIIESYHREDSKHWEDLKSKTIYASFLKGSLNVPAYKSFLKEHNINRHKFKNVFDLQILPAINKKNYFYKHPISDFFEQHKGLKQALVTTSTSGSTGVPTYFFRSEELDWQYSVLAEQFLKNGPKGTTLVIDCFGMGVWIGGLLTYEAFRIAGIRGLPVTIIAPGINKKEIFHSLRNLAPNFDNVIIAGYPPFIKDVIDESLKEKIDFKKFNTRLLFAAESFSEDFRDYLCSKVGAKDVIHNSMNIYGSAELGAMAFETPFSILVRRLALKHLDIYAKMFTKDKLPTLAQYNSSFVAFEERQGEVLISAPTSLPLIKYQIGDNGGVFTAKEVISIFSEFGIDLKLEAKKHGVNVLNLPFVYVYERNDFSTNLYGLQIYPQTLKRVLEHKSMSNSVTGKFVMLTKFDKQNDQFLEVNVEIKPNIRNSAALGKKIKMAIVRQLLQENSEYRELQKMIGKKSFPTVKLWPYNDELYFKSGIKQQWVKK